MQQNRSCSSQVRSRIAAGTDDRQWRYQPGDYEIGYVTNQIDDGAANVLLYLEAPPHIVDFSHSTNDALDRFWVTERSSPRLGASCFDSLDSGSRLARNESCLEAHLARNRP